MESTEEKANEKHELRNALDVASSAAENGHLPSVPAHSPARSMTSSVSTTGRRSLQGTITIETFDRTAKRGPLMNSPRSLLSCAQEGFDPVDDFVAKSWKDFMLVCKGNKELALLRETHNNQRRDNAIQLVVARRDKIIAAASSSDMTPQHSPASIGAGKRLAGGSRAASQSPPSASPDPQRNVGGGSEDETGDLMDDQSLSSERQRSEQRRRDGDPEAYLREIAEGKQKRTLKAIEKMKRVAAANALRDQIAAEHSKAMAEKLAEQEIERKKKKERDELLQRMREAAAKKRDQQAAFQRMRREQQRILKQQAAQEEHARNAEKLLEKEKERQKIYEEKQTERELENAEKRLEVNLRLAEITQSSSLVEEEKVKKLLDKIVIADERREKLRIQQEAEREARRLAAEQRASETKDKKKRAEDTHAQKISTFKEKFTEADRKREATEAEHQQYLIQRKLEEQQKEQKRIELLQKAEREAQREAEELKKQQQEDEERLARMAHEKQRQAALRALEKELVVEDRVALVQRFKRLQEYERELAAEKLKNKLNRISALQEEGKEEHQARKAIQRNAFLDRLKVKKLPPSAWTPGPADYSVVESMECVASKGPAVKIATAGRENSTSSLITTPGPGQYPAIQKWKQSGVKLPPKDLSPEHLLQARSKLSQSRSRNSSSSRTRANEHSSNFELPSIEAGSRGRREQHGVRSESAPLVNPRGSSSRVPPDVVMDVDYDSDEDFEKQN